MCNTDNEDNLSSDMVFQSGVLSLLMLLKLLSATHVDTGYVRSVLTAT